MMKLEDVWKLKRGEPGGLQEGQDLADRWTQVESSSLISPTGQKHTEPTGEVPNQQNSGTKEKPLKQEDNVGRRGQKTWLI